MATDLGISLAGIVIQVGGGRKMDNAVKSYNFQLGEMGSLQPILDGDGVGVAWTF